LQQESVGVETKIVPQVNNCLFSLTGCGLKSLRGILDGIILEKKRQDNLRHTEKFLFLY
jgi:hypothetical protein